MGLKIKVCLGAVLGGRRALVFLPKTGVVSSFIALFVTGPKEERQVSEKQRN